MLSFRSEFQSCPCFPDLAAAGIGMSAWDARDAGQRQHKHILLKGGPTCTYSLLAPNPCLRALHIKAALWQLLGSAESQVPLISRKSGHVSVTRPAERRPAQTRLGHPYGPQLYPYRSPLLSLSECPSRR